MLTKKLLQKTSKRKVCFNNNVHSIRIVRIYSFQPANQIDTWYRGMNLSVIYDRKEKTFSDILCKITLGNHLVDLVVFQPLVA